MNPIEPPNEATEQLKRLLRNPKFWLIVLGLLVIGWLSTLEGLTEGAGSGGLLFVVALLYFVPAVIARKKHNASAVFMVNLFFGWTLIGWVIALVMAVSNPPTVVVQQIASPMTGRACPFCAEQIQPAAVVCKHCGRDLPAG